jgi:glycosyltransferase involved in cell wall biosynthesis
MDAPTSVASADRPPERSLLDSYRRHFTLQGLQLPLPTVPFREGGLLGQLPKATGDNKGWPWTTEAPPPQPGGHWPKLTIIMPSFNQGRYIEEAVRSILLQNYPALEFVVIDGGSTDGTTAILERYRPWLSYVRSGKDRGQAHAINMGFAIASGYIIGWLNSDDAYLPGAFERVGRLFAQDPKLEFVYGDGVYFAESENKAYYSSAALALDRYLQFGGLVLTHAAFWKNSITEPMWEAMKCNVDGELWFRLLRGARRRHLPVPLGAMRGHPEAKSVSERWLQGWREDDERIWAEHGRPHAPRSLRSIEFRRVQRAYGSWIARRWRTERRLALAATNWRVSPP